MVDLPRVRSVAECAAELEAAQAEYEEAASRVSNARSIEVKALNSLNEAQKQFDAAVARVKQQSPRESDWRRIEMMSGAKGV